MIKVYNSIKAAAETVVFLSFFVSCLHTQNNNHPFPLTCCRYAGGLERMKEMALLVRYLTKDGLLLTESISANLKEQFDSKDTNVEGYVKSNYITSKEEMEWDSLGIFHVKHNYYIGEYRVHVGEDLIIGTVIKEGK